MIEVRVTEESGYPGPFCSRLFRRGRFKVGRVDLSPLWKVSEAELKRCLIFQRGDNKEKTKMVGPSPSQTGKMREVREENKDGKILLLLRKVQGLVVKGLCPFFKTG